MLGPSPCPWAWGWNAPIGRAQALTGGCPCAMKASHPSSVAGVGAEAVGGGTEGRAGPSACRNAPPLSGRRLVLEDQNHRFGTTELSRRRGGRAEPERGPGRCPSVRAHPALRGLASGQRSAQRTEIRKGRSHSSGTFSAKRSVDDAVHGRRCSHPAYQEMACVDRAPWQNASRIIGCPQASTRGTSAPRGSGSGDGRIAPLSGMALGEA